MPLPLGDEPAGLQAKDLAHLEEGMSFGREFMLAETVEMLFLVPKGAVLNIGWVGELFSRHF